MSKYYITYDNNIKEYKATAEYLMENFEYMENNGHVDDDTVSNKLQIGIIFGNVIIDIDNMICSVPRKVEDYPQISLSELKAIIRDRKLDVLLNN